LSFQKTRVIYNKEGSLEWVIDKAEQGDVDAQIELGNYYSENEEARDDKEALKWYRRAAAQGSAVAQNEIGKFYYYDSYQGNKKKL